MPAETLRQLTALSKSENADQILARVEQLTASGDIRPVSQARQAAARARAGNQAMSGVYSTPVQLYPDSTIDQNTGEPLYSANRFIEGLPYPRRPPPPPAPIQPRRRAVL